MAGGNSANPMNSYHRQKRKKELDKNKKARIAARDEQVVQSKTVGEISKQLTELEKRKGGGSGSSSNHGETMKLQRLQKELKLVKEAAATAAAAAAAGNNSSNSKHLQHAAAIIQKQQQQFQMDDARKSIYYDATMNPYGAPPPGKPRLYHSRGGGTTMNADFAVVPGLEEEHQKTQMAEQPHYINSYGKEDGLDVAAGAAAIPQSSVLPPPTINRRQEYRQPPPPPPPRQQHHQRHHQQHHHQQNHYQQQHHQQHGAPQRSSFSKIPPPPPPPPFPSTNNIPPPPPPPPKDTVPSLPQPSASVVRTNSKRKRNTLAADIWASSAEVTYHRNQDGLDLEEGSVKKEQSLTTSTTITQKPNDTWYYYDSSQQLQGPFTALQMTQWQQAGYFPPDTLVRNGTAFRFVPVGSISDGNFERYRAPKQTKRKKEDDYQEEKDDGMESRIQALRKQQQEPTKETPKETETPTETDDAVQARIEALCDARQPQLDEENDIQARIEALRNSSSRAQEEEQEKDDANNHDLQSRINALRSTVSTTSPSHEDAPTEAEIQLPSSISAPSPVGIIDHALSPVEPSAALPTAYPEPAAYPQPEAYPEPAAYPEPDAYPEPAACPADDNYEPPAYSSVDAVAPHPMDDDTYYPPDVAYPVMGAYPVDDAYPMNDMYPTNDNAYPVDDGGVTSYPTSNNNVPDDVIPNNVVPLEEDTKVAANTSQESAPKKVVKVDQEIVGFLPTNLQNKRRVVAKKSSKKRAISKPAAPNANSAALKQEDASANKKTKSVGDDYDAFMKEISNL